MSLSIKTLLTLCIILCFFISGEAHEIHLNNGRVIETNVYYEEGDVIIFEKYGSEIEISRDSVLKIINKEKPPATNNPPKVLMTQTGESNIRPCKDKEKVEKWLSQLVTCKYETRQAIFKHLAQLDEDCALFAYLNIIQRHDYQITRIYEQAVKGLIKLGDISVPPLINILKSRKMDEYIDFQDKEVIYKAKKVLSALGATCIPDLISSFNTVKKGQQRLFSDIIYDHTRKAKSIDQQVVNFWMHAENSTDKHIKKLALQAIGFFNKVDSNSPDSGGDTHNQAFEILTKSVNNPDSSVRTNVAKSLGKLKDKRAVPYLKQLMIDKNMSVSRAAFAALGKTDKEEFTNALFIFSNDSYLEHRITAIKFMATSKNKVFESTLMSCLDDSDYRIRASAIRGVSNLKIQIPEKFAHFYFEDEDRYSVQGAAKGALLRLGKPSIPFIASRLHSPSFDKRRLAYKIILDFDDALIYDTMMEEFHNSNYDLISYHINYYIKKYEPRMLGILRSCLDYKSDTTFATKYLNSGIAELNQAASDWAKKHGYVVMPGRPM